jgi:hypothetical protein
MTARAVFALLSGAGAIMFIAGIVASPLFIPLMPQ